MTSDTTLSQEKLITDGKDNSPSYQDTNHSSIKYFSF